MSYMFDRNWAKDLGLCLKTEYHCRTYECFNTTIGTTRLILRQS